MSDAIHAEADIREFEAALVRFQNATQLGWPEVIKMQARLLVERLIEWTPPFGSDKAAQRKGQKAVNSDIRRVFVDFCGFEFRDLSIQKAWETEDKDALARIFKDSPALSRFTLLPVPVPQIHEGLRVKGRVPKRYRPRFVVMDGRRTGEGKIASYVSKVGKRVGKAKAGWLIGAKALASKFPAWITKTGGESLGAVNDRTTMLDHPAYTISNLVNYISDILGEDKVRQILATRIRDMEKNAEAYLRAKARQSRL